MAEEETTSPSFDASVREAICVRWSWMRFGWLALLGCGGTATGEQGAPQQVYVQFDGISIQQGAEDATTNTSSAFAGNLTGYQRATRIADTLAAMASIVEPFRLDVVTERPAVGRYDMIVIAGRPEEAGLPAGQGGVAAIDCDNAIPNKLVAIFGNAFPDGFTPGQLASLAIAGLGTSQGLPSSNVADDCLCWSGIACTPTTECTFGGAGTAIAAGDECGAGTMDPFAEFAAVFPLR